MTITDANRVRGPLDISRAETMAHFYLNGATLQEIGDVWGISSERARQVLRHAGVPIIRREPIDPIRLLRVARSSQSLSETVQRTGWRFSGVRDCLVALGVLPALTRLWAWRQCRSGTKFTDGWLLARMRELAAELGRTPSANDLNKHKPTSVTYQRRFGSVSNAQRLAGLVPRKSGDWWGICGRGVATAAARRSA